MQQLGDVVWFDGIDRWLGERDDVLAFGCECMKYFPGKNTT
jgi:hypothetical protein